MIAGIRFPQREVQVQGYLEAIRLILEFSTFDLEAYFLSLESSIFNLDP